ncbi:MAG: SAM-dependent methyltransferase [Phycisphaerales bacterium]
MAGQRDIHDHYFREAKRAGYVARSAYKLKEIQERRRVIPRGARVLDLGAAPGAWLQVACQAIGPRRSGGFVVGVDVKPASVPQKFCDDRVRFVEADAFDLTPESLAQQLGVERIEFDVVLSDMMGSTSGHQATDHFQSIHLARRALEVCESMLRRGGVFVVKVFEGELYPEFLGETRARFKSVKGFKPKASRNESTEMYVIATGYLGPDAQRNGVDP